MGRSQGGWVGLARGRLGADDRGVGGVSGWADGGRSLRVGRSLSGDARAVGLNRRGRSSLRLRGRSGRSGRDNRAALGGGHVARSGGSDGGRVAGVVLGGLESLDRGGADGGLRGRSAVDLVSQCGLVLLCRESVYVQWRRSIDLPPTHPS
jgi:hypothetical protein